MSTTHLDRKELKRPDAFLLQAHHIVDFINNNAKAVLIILGILFASGLSFALYQNAHNHREDLAASALFQAKQDTAKLEKVTADFKGTNAAFEAFLSLGDASLKNKQLDKGVGYYQRAIENAPSRALKAYATHALAYAYEESKQPAQAIEALRKSLGFAVPALKADTLMALARNYEQQGDKAQALAQYDTLIKDFVNTPVAKAAEARKAGLK